MESLNAILAPVASATKHLLHALNVARTDFASQASKTQRRVSGDLGSAREDLGEAVSGFASSLDDARTSIARAAEPYRVEALRAYGRGGKYLKSALDSASEKSIALADDFRREKSMTRFATNPYVLGGLAAGAGFLVLRALRKRRLAKAAGSKTKSARLASDRATTSRAGAGSQKKARAPRRRPINGNAGASTAH